MFIVAMRSIVGVLARFVNSPTRMLRDHYAALLRGDVADGRGDHAVF
jgi:hypothetical protein